MSMCLYCISHDERTQVREALLMIDLLRRQLQRDNYTQAAAVELQTYAKVITRIISELPQDPRNAELPNPRPCG
jgi:hypothetical protein